MPFYDKKITNRSEWGWKDPRTSLFLDVYEKLLKEKIFTFLFKKRITRNIIRDYTSLYIETWICYNEKIKKHVESVCSQKVFVTNYHDLLNNCDVCYLC